MIQSKRLGTNVYWKGRPSPNLQLSVKSTPALIQDFMDWMEEQ